jgi:hypothetical protein
MMVATRSPLKVHVPLRVDPEQEIVARLIEAIGEAGLSVDPISIVNFYVALKSKPLAILAGPAQSGKIALVKSLTHILTGGDCLRCQTLIGHPYWAARSPNVALFTEAHTRLNASKILALIEEAWEPENADKVFHACLTRITPAELLGFFSDVAFQVRHGEIMQLPSIHLTEPMPYPPNLSLIGTMDTVRFDWWNADLLSMTTVIQWPSVEVHPVTSDYRTEAVPSGEAEFLRSRVRNKKLARRKLDQILGWRLQPIEPLRRVRELLEKTAIRRLPQPVMDEVMIYLANSWSQAGAGLFDPQRQRNVMIALDLVIAQTLLPHLGEVLSQSAALVERLGELLCGQFPHSEAFLTSLGRA